MDPTFDDALLSVGAFNYVVGVIPGFVRAVLWPLGIRSAGKDLGIQQLEEAATKGKNAATDARMMLLVVYNREKRYDDALHIADQLHGRYPGNFFFELAQASTYGKMKRWDDAVHTYEQILAKAQEGKNGYERLAVHKVYYSLGTSNVEPPAIPARRSTRLTMWPKAKMRRQTIKPTRFCGEAKSTIRAGSGIRRYSSTTPFSG